MSVYIPEKKDLAIRDMVRELLARITELFSIQVELVKSEIKAGGSKMAKTAVFGSGVMLFGTVFVLLLALSLIVGLGHFLTFTGAVLATTGIFFAVTVVFAMMTVQEVKKNIDNYDVDGGVQ